MPKVEIFCEIRKRNIKVDQKLADALVKMKRASYNTKVIEAPIIKVMVADFVEPAVEVADFVEPKKRRGRKKKEEVNETVVEENFESVEETDSVSY